MSEIKKSNIDEVSIPKILSPFCLLFNKVKAIALLDLRKEINLVENWYDSIFTLLLK